MHKTFALIFFLFIHSHFTHAQEKALTYTINKDHSQILFNVSYLRFSSIQGSFLDFRGQAQIEEGSNIPLEVDLSLNAQSITTYDLKRDHHLKKEDFLWVSNFAQILFRSQVITQLDPQEYGENAYLIDGILTFQERELPQQFIARYLGQEIDPWDKLSLFYEFKGELSRKELGLNWNKLLESGDLLVGDKVQIEGRFQFQDPKNITPFSTHMIPGPRAGTQVPADLPKDQNIDLAFDEPQEVQPRERVYDQQNTAEPRPIAPFALLLILALLALVGVISIGLGARYYAQKKAPHIKGISHLGDLTLVLLIFAYAVLIGQLFRR
jgi:polyisoprenoid-binding protein YceI